MSKRERQTIQQHPDLEGRDNYIYETQPAHLAIPLSAMLHIDQGYVSSNEDTYNAVRPYIEHNLQQKLQSIDRMWTEPVQSIVDTWAQEVPPAMAFGRNFRIKK